MFIIELSYKSGLTEIKSGLTGLTSNLKTVQDDNARLRTDLDNLRRARLKLDRSSLPAPGKVSDDCARWGTLTETHGAERVGSRRCVSATAGGPWPRARDRAAWR